MRATIASVKIRELLVDTMAYTPPARALAELSTEDAERRLPNANHSIAEILAHMTFWQDWFCRRCEGVAAPMAARAAEGWPPVAPNTWPLVKDRFFAGLERAASLGDDESRSSQPITPAIEFPPLATYTVREALVHVSTHNAHHMGQIITLRQMLKAWPPSSGGWTW
jgi:uncharacterized damage-inducible protein DinB